VEESANGLGLEMVFRKISPDHRGKYACHAEIDGQQERTEFELKVIEPIAFDPQNEEQHVEEGTAEFLLACNVSGRPRPRVTWNVRGTVVRGGVAAPKFKVVEAGLLVREVVREDAGSYKCAATQMEGGITDFATMVIQLKVQHEPYWNEGQREQFYGFISGHTNLTCSAIAEPPAEYIWLDRRKVRIENGERYGLSTMGDTSVLTVEVHDETLGDYTCAAFNKMGRIERKVTLAEGAKPGVPHISWVRIDQANVTFRIEVSRNLTSVR